MTDDLTINSLVNRGEYLSAHYIAAVLPRELKRGTLARWRHDEKAGRDTPRTGLRSLRRAFFADRLALAEDAERYNTAPRTDADTSTNTGPDAARAGNGYLAWRKTLSGLHADVLQSLGFSPVAQRVTVVRGGSEHAVPVAHAEAHIVAVECGWAVDVDAALDPQAAGRLLDPVPLEAREVVSTGADLASFLFGAEDPPRYVLILAGGVVILADRTEWGEGRFLGVSLDTALGRNDTRPGGELDVLAALFGADSLRPPAEGGAEPLAELVAASHQHAVGVSAELRQGLQESVELIANEVLTRIRDAGVQPEEITDTGDLARQLTHESLRYLYRILFLLYAEARPDLGILPADYDEYVEGYGLARLGELVTQPLLGEEAGRGFHLYESLDLLSIRGIAPGAAPPAVLAIPTPPPRPTQPLSRRSARARGSGSSRCARTCSNPARSGSSAATPWRTRGTTSRPTYRPTRAAELVPDSWIPGCATRPCTGCCGC